MSTTPAVPPQPDAPRRGLPMAVWALLGGVLVLVLAMVPTLWHWLAGAPAAPGAAGTAGMASSSPADGRAPAVPPPWQVQPLPDGSSQVMGLHLGVDTLAALQARLGDALQPALVARLGEAGTLEALVEPFAAGFVSGRLVLAFDAPEDARRRWHDSATQSSAMEGGVRRFTLPEPARREAGAMRLAGISFLPTLKLGADDVRQRFGPPAEVRALAAESAQAWLYPDRGLAITIKPGSRAVLQYVAPNAFDQRLKAPLLAAGAAPLR